MSNSFDQYAEGYEGSLDQGLRLSGEGRVYFLKNRIDYLYQKLAGMRVTCQSFLDFGCGDGETVAYVEKSKFSQVCLGVDPSKGLIAKAKANHAASPGAFVELEKQWSGPLVDLVHCNGVFHHIDPDGRGQALEWVRNALIEGGYFAFFENNPWNLGTRWVMSRIPFDRDAKVVSPRAATRMLRQAGFEILSLDALFFFPRWLAMMRPFERFLRNVPLGAQYLVLARKPAGNDKGTITI